MLSILSPACVKSSRSITKGTVVYTKSSFRIFKSSLATLTMEQFSSSSGSSGASSSSSSVGSSSSSSSNQSESEILVSGGDRSAENCCNGSGSSTQMASSAREMQITADKALCDSILDEGVRNCGDSCGNGVISISDHIFNNNAVSATDPHSESCDCWLGEKKQVITGSATVSPQNEDRVGVDPEIALIASIAKNKEDSLLAIRKLRSLQIDKKRKRAKLLKAFKGRCNATSKLCREVICLSEQMSQIVDNISAYVEYEPPPISVDSENSASNSIFQKSYIATSSKRYILSCRRSPLNRRFPPPEYFASFFRKIISFLNGNVSEIFDKSKQADILKTKTTNMELILSQLCRQENDANVRFKEIDERLAKVRVEIRHWFESFVFELNSAIVCPNQASPDVTALFHSCMNTLIDVLDQIDNYENQVDHFSTILSELSQSVQICTQNLQSVSKMQESLCQIFASISEQTKFLDKTSNIYQMSVYKSAVGNNSQNEMMVEYFSDIYNFICSKIDNRVEERNKETLILCEIQENSAKMRQIGVDMAKKLSKVEKLIEKCRAENQNLNSTLDQCKIDKDGKRAKMKQKLLTLEARLIESLNEKEILRVEMHKVSSQTVDDQILDEKLNRRLQMYMQDIEHEDFRIAQRIESSIVARSENEGVLSNLVEKLCNKNRTLEKLSSKLSEQGNGAIQRLVDEISELKKQKRRLRKDIDKMNTKKISNAEYLKNARKENTILAAKISTTYSIDRSNLIESMKRALKVNEMLEIRLCREEKTYETIRKDLLSLQIFIKNQHSQKLGLKDPSLAEKPPMPLEMNQDERTIAPHASPFKLLNPFNNEKFLVNEQVFFEKEDDSKKCENEDTCEENSEACTKESTLTMSSKNSTHAVSTKNSQGKQDIATNRTTNVSFYSTASENTQSAIEVRDRAITKNTLQHTYCADSSIDKKFRTQYDPVAESRAVKRIFKRCSRRPAVQLFPGKP